MDALSNQIIMVKIIRTCFRDQKIIIYLKEKRIDFSIIVQLAKKVVSDSPGLVDFAIGLVIFDC